MSKPVIAWTTPKMMDQLKKIEEEATRLAEGRIVRTEEGRHVVTLVRRLIEVLVHGEPKTTLAPTHHE